MSSTSTGLRIAMWSGPRNISTAMMRAWDSRADTVVCDEPFYAHYLLTTRREHPGRDEILTHHETDWRVVADRLTGPIPGGKAIFYQKHMAHHLLPGMTGAWMEALRHAFLIRDPREMLTSLVEVLPEPRLADTGLPQQWELFQQVRAQLDTPPPVLVARDVLEHPRAMLRTLCDALGVPFDEAMLSWEPGPRPTDGIWARHWYATVEASTGFQPYRPKPDPVPDHLRGVYTDAVTYYEKLHPFRLTPEQG